jgi:hypothetical protein
LTNSIKMDNKEIRNWSDEKRILLDGILNEIIPESNDGKLPAAGELGVADFLAERLNDTPGLEETLTSMLTRATEMVKNRGKHNILELNPLDRVKLLKELETEEPEFFLTFIKYTYMGYYTHPTIPPYFGLSKKPPQPEGYELPLDKPEHLTRLIEPVINRGICYKEC